MGILEERVLATALACAWGGLSYAILLRNERIENVDGPRGGSAVWVIACAAVAAAWLLPTTSNTCVALAIAGFGIASWGDMRTRFLWDEIVLGTILACAAAAIAGGRSAAALEGAVLCGSLLYAIYFGGIACKRETGFGDVKLALGIGVALGPVSGAAAIALGSIAWIVFTLAWARRARIPLEALRQMPLPYGPGLVAGLACAALATARYVAM